MTQTDQQTERLTDLATRLATLEAKEEIREFIALYCATNDRMDAVDVLADLFAEDGVMRNAGGSYEGKAAIHAYYAGFFNGDTKFSRHHVMNQVITLLGPDRARHQAYFLAILGRDGDSKVIFGQYDDVVVRRDGQWRFVEKVNDVVAPATLASGWAEGFARHEPLLAQSVGAR